MVFFLFFIIVILCFFLISINAKLKRIETMLKPPASAPEEHSVISPSLSQETTDEPLFEEEKVTDEPFFAEKTPERSFWRSFWSWFCTGSSADNVSVEYAAATTWLMRSGVLILLCGIGFFLKYSIENGLIGPVMRVILTFLAGAGMFCGGTYGIRKRFHTLAVGILAAGAVTLYMGSFAGYKLYHLLPVTAALLLMILTTAATMLTAVKKGLLPVALTGCTGAYLTPLLLSDGSGNLPFLAGYTALISAGILLAAREHRWRSLETLAFFFSFIIFAAGGASLPHKVTLSCILFLLVNYLVFTLIPVIRKRESVFGLTEWLLPVGAAAFTLFTGIHMIFSCCGAADEKLYSAGFSVIISAAALLEGIHLARKRGGAGNLLPAFLSASFFSLALAIPLALQNSGSTAAAWAVLGFVLVLSFVKSGQNTLAILSIPAFAAAVAAGFDCTPEHCSILERFFRFGVPVLAMGGGGVLLQKHSGTKWAPVKKLYFCGCGILFLYYSSVEVYENLKSCLSLREFRNGGLSVWWGIYAVALLAAGIGKNIRALRSAGLLLFAVCLCKVYLIDISSLNTLHKVIAFLLLGLLFLGGATAYIFCRKRFGGER